MAYPFPHQSLRAESSYLWVLGPARIESRAASKIGCNLQGRSDNYRILRSLQHSSSRGFGGDVEPRQINTLVPSPFQCGRPMHWTFEGTNAFRMSIGSIGAILTLQLSFYHCYSKLSSRIAGCEAWKGFPHRGPGCVTPKKWCEGCHHWWNIKQINNIKQHQILGIVATESKL